MLVAALGTAAVGAAAMFSTAASAGGNVAWSVSVGAPGFAVSAGQPGYYGAPYRPYYRPHYYRPAPVAYRPYYAPYRVVVPQPVYAPNVVARAILHATVRPPTRSLCRRRIARHE